jgi:hypothetical protein
MNMMQVLRSRPYILSMLSTSSVISHMYVDVPCELIWACYAIRPPGMTRVKLF